MEGKVRVERRKKFDVQLSSVNKVEVHDDDQFPTDQPAFVPGS